MEDQDIEQQVYDLLKKAEPEKPRSLAGLNTLGLFLVLVAISAVIYFSFLWAVRPRGAIISPPEGTTVPHVFEIQGYTKLLPHVRDNIWITVDVPSIGLCWPKRQVFKPNEPFTAKIDERGPNAEFIVSLYALYNDDHQKILDWQAFRQKTGSKEGLPMLPEDLKLCSIKLKLK